MTFRLKLLLLAAQLIELACSVAIDELETKPIDLSAELAEIINNPIRRSQYISDNLKPQQYLALVEQREQEVSAGPLLGVALSAVFTGLTGGLVAGALALASGLIQILLSPQPQEEPKRAEDPNFAPQFGSNEGTGAVVRLGQPIGAIFCSRSLDPTGGYTTGGSLINARIETIDGSQVAYLLYSLGHGEIGQVDLGKTLLNQQPINISDTSLRLGWKPGKQNDPPVPDFVDLSQNIVVRVNQYSGVNLINEKATVDIVGGANWFTVASNEIESYPINGMYYYLSPAGRGEFKITSRVYVGVVNNAQIWRVDTDTIIPQQNSAIYSFSRAKYRTTRRVNQIDLNFVMKVWARDAIGSLIDFAQSYILRIRRYNDTNFVAVCRFYVRSYNAKDLFRSIEIKDLQLYTYDIQIDPEAESSDTGLQLIELQDSAAFIERTYNGYTVRFQGIESGFTAAQLNALTDQKKARTPQHSAQSGATLQILHVNEREYVASTPRAKNLGYPGLACVWAVKRFTIDTTGQLQFQFFVPEGIIVQSLLAAGTASPASATNMLTQVNHGLTFAPGQRLRNTDKGVDSEIVSATANAITTAEPLNWEQGDRWYAYSRRSSCWWPEIKAWLVRDPRFGASESITADFDLDYPSLVAATKYCSGQNQFNQSFAWHGALNRPQKVAEVDAENCIKVNLFPIDVDGAKGYWPMESPDTVGLFNITNADNFRVTKLPELEINPPTSCTISYKEQQQAWLGDDSLRFLDLSVTAQVKNAASTREVSLSIPECTSRKQAIVTSKIRLNFGRYFGRLQVSFSAKQIEAVSLELGGVARIQLQEMNYDEEQSGIVIEVDATGRFRLDNEFTMVRSITAEVANPTGLSDPNIDFILAGVATGDLVRNEESGVVSEITLVATHTITCNPPVPADTYYQIANLTTGDVLLWRGSAARSLPPALFTVEYLNGHIWYTTANTPPIEVGEVVQIGSNQIQEREFQVLSVGYQIPYSDDKASEMEIPVTGASWDSRMFKFDDLEVVTIDEVLAG